MTTDQIQRMKALQIKRQNNTISSQEYLELSKLEMLASKQPVQAQETKQLSVPNVKQFGDSFDSSVHDQALNERKTAQEQRQQEINKSMALGNVPEHTNIFMSFDEASEKTGLSKGTLYQYVHRGNLKTVDGKLDKISVVNYVTKQLSERWAKLNETQNTLNKLTS